MANSTYASSQSNSHPLIKTALLMGFVLALILSVGLVSAHQPILAVVIVLFALLILAAVIWPDSMTLLAVFLIYSNAPAVMVNYHGLPYIVGALVPFLMVIPLFNYVIIKRQKLLITPIFWVVLFFYFIQTLGVLVTKDINVGLSNLIKAIVEGIVLYFVVINVVRTKETLYRSVWALLAAGAIIGALGLYQVATGTYENNYAGFAQISNAEISTGQTSLFGDVTQPRLTGSVGEQNRHGQVMLMLVPLGIYIIWGEKKLYLRLLAALATALIAGGVATSFSRGAAVGFAVALIFMAAMRYIKFKQIVAVILGIALLLIAFPHYATRLIGLEGLVGLVQPGVSSSQTSPDGALEGRTTSMLAAAQVFADHPIIGVGTGMFGYYYQDYAKYLGPRWQAGERRAHDLYVGLLAENGLLGFIAFMALIVMTISLLAKARKELLDKSPLFAALATGFIFSIATYLGTGIGLHFGYYRFFWLIMALAYAASQVATVYPLEEELTKPKIAIKASLHPILEQESDSMT